MQKILERLGQQLTQRQQQGNLRFLPRNLPASDFASNDYLGLARNKILAENIQQAAKELHTLHGATGSRLITGNLMLAEELEQELAEYLQAEACLVYSTGYMANQGLLSALLQRGDTVIYDELSHACIKDGCRLSLADRFSFRHNDLDQLRQKMNRAKGQVVVVVESVYSMDGDEAQLPDLVQLCKQYGAALVVDEAHSTGLWGPDGAGSCVAQGVAEEVLARVHTFGKGLGVHAACVAGKEILLQYLLNFSRTFIYTTAMPAHSLLAVREAVRYRRQHPELVEQLFSNIVLFHHLLQESSESLYKQFIPSRSPIQAVVIPGNERVRSIALALQQEGFMVWPILAPTVAEGEERLRICLHSFNTREEIKELVSALNRHLS